jgi:hypothetical protein
MFDVSGSDLTVPDKILRHMRRWRERYVEEGYNGLFDRRRVQHFQEKLQAEHGIELSYTWVKQALQGARLVGRGPKRGAHANGASGGRCRGCCCTSTAAATNGFRTNAGTT